MKMSTKARYGLYAAVELSKTYDEGFVRVSALSHSINVSDGYLEQILALLKRDNILVAQRGAQGGYRLSRPPKEITVGAVLRSVEDNLEIVECLSGSCNHSVKCISHSLWDNLYKRINEYLDSVNLQQLIDGDVNY